jgi:hypothetical protein
LGVLGAAARAALPLRDARAGDGGADSGGAMDWMAWIAEQRIQEAQTEGVFENLEGSGRPLPPDRFAHLPPEYRLAARVLSNAGLAPETVGLLRDLRQTQRRWGAANTPDEEARIRREYVDAEFKYNMAMERQRRMMK